MIGWLVVFYVPSTARSLISVLLSQYYEFISFTKFKVILEKLKTFLGHAIHNGMSPLRETVILMLGQNNQTIHGSQCETHCL